MNEKRFIIYKTWKSEYKLVILSFVSMFLSIFLSNQFPATVLTVKLFQIGKEMLILSIPIFWLPAAFFLLWALIRIYNVRYSMTAKGLETIVGILAITKRSVKIRYEDIRSVETEQTIIERILNIGTVEVGTSATGGIEIVFEGVDSPQELQILIQKEKGRRLALHQSSKGFTSNE